MMMMMTTSIATTNQEVMTKTWQHQGHHLIITGDAKKTWPDTITHTLWVISAVCERQSRLIPSIQHAGKSSRHRMTMSSRKLLERQALWMLHQCSKTLLLLVMLSYQHLRLLVYQVWLHQSNIQSRRKSSSHCNWSIHPWYLTPRNPH